MGQHCCSIINEGGVNADTIDMSRNPSGDSVNRLYTIDEADVNNIDLFTDQFESKPDEISSAGRLKKESNLATIYNYEGQDFSSLIETSLMISATKESIPPLTFEIKTAIAARSQELQKLRKDDIGVLDKCYKVEVGDRKLLLISGSSIEKSTTYGILMSHGKEYFEGVLKNYQIYEGLLVTSSGDYYYGLYENFLPNGYTELQCINGDVFEGFMRLGKKDGTGKITWTDGSSFKGKFKDDKKSGQGIYTYANGDIYSGYFRLDMKEGPGNLLSLSRHLYVE